MVLWLLCLIREKHVGGGCDRVVLDTDAWVEVARILFLSGKHEGGICDPYVSFRRKQ